MKKKAQVQSSISSVIALIIGVGITAIIILFFSVFNGQTFQLTESKVNSIGNNVLNADSVSLVFGVGSKLSHNDIQSSSFVLFNSTNDVLGAGNYTLDANQGIVTLNAGATGILNNTNAFANYTWGAEEVRSSVQSGIVAGFTGFETSASFLPIFVLAIIIVLILTLVLGFAMFTGKNMGGSL